MLRGIGFFKQAVVAANLVCATSSQPANTNPPAPPPTSAVGNGLRAVPAAVQQNVRFVPTPVLRPIFIMAG
jgi:hypothetical protein